MPSHQERIRRNYTCWNCDGEGRVDDYEGSYECDTCHGAGTMLSPRPETPPAPAWMKPMINVMTNEALRVLEKSLEFTSMVNRSYD